MKRYEGVMGLAYLYVLGIGVLIFGVTGSTGFQKP